LQTIRLFSANGFLAHSIGSYGGGMGFKNTGLLLLDQRLSRLYAPRPAQDRRPGARIFTRSDAGGENASLMRWGLFAACSSVSVSPRWPRAGSASRARVHRATLPTRASRWATRARRARSMARCPRRHRGATRATAAAKTRGETRSPR